MHLALAFRDVRAGGRQSDLVEGGLSLLLGFLVLLAPGLAAGALALLLGISFAAAGVGKVLTGWRRRGETGWGALLLDGLFDVAIGAAVALQWPLAGLTSIGLALGFYMFSVGSTALRGAAAPAGGPSTSAIVSEEEEQLGRALAIVEAEERARRPIDFYWTLVFLLTFFAIHVGRMGAPLSLRGLGPPLLAAIGDTLSAVLLAFLLLIPLRLAVIRTTRPLARRVWKGLRGRLESSEPLPLRWFLARLWLRARARFSLEVRQATSSPARALGFSLRVGVPLVAVIVATNPIWGFSWYFNSENWPTALWERWVEYRVDDWRAAMSRAVEADLAGEATPFAVHPDGLVGGEDFSFVVIGDTGEGDPSQHILRDRYLELGYRPDVKFLVVSSDVIYPAGEMRDYEEKFYLPFKGFAKPIYAIPGNHDWYDALDAFAANFYTPAAAARAIHARVDSDHGVSATTEERTRWLLDEARRLRGEYGVAAGLQRGPFFELQLEDFALIAVDTGVLRSVDEHQLDWLRAALDRARGKFVFALLGHPFYPGGVYQGTDDEPFAALHDLLRSHGVPLVMAGDTHDLEYYREDADDGAAMHHIVNGGGGAYLSIGTALDWPAAPPAGAAAFYPSTAALTAKLDRQVSRWTRPVWWWVKYLNGWPSTPEFLSGAFDFNRAPFFQSFVEVRVERSANRVRILPHAAHGRLTWSDLQRIGAVLPPGAGEDDEVEFVLPLRPE